MPLIPGWIVVTLVAVAVGANVGNPLGAKIVRDANNQCRQKAAGKEWRVVSSVDKKGVRWLQCEVKQAPTK